MFHALQTPFYTLRYIQMLLLVSVYITSILFTHIAHATEPTVRITEIMYNAEGSDEGKEFVEIINDGTEEIDMTTVTFFERNDRHDGRAITQGRGSTTLQPGTVAIIVANPEAFLHHYPSYGGTLLDTTNFALLNAGTTISLKKENMLLSSISYTIQNGANGDGNTLHSSQDGTITAGKPSPGIADGATPITTTSNTTENTEEERANTPTETQTPANTTTPTNTTPAPNTQPTASTETAAVTGTETPKKATMVTNPTIIFSASITQFSVVRKKGEEKETLYGLWNFGDGSYAYGKTIEHAYLHPGAYIIVFQELDKESGSEGVALQKEVQVLFPQISIERIDDAFIRLHNHHPFILDISGWRIEAEGTVFDFHEKSLVPKQGSTVIPFAVAEEQDIFFITAGGGQFSGKRPNPDTAQEQETPLDEEQPEEKEEENTEEETKQETVTEKTINKTQKYPRETNTGVFITKTNENQKETETGIDMRMIVVWAALLIGVMTVALVPIILKRRERERQHRQQ